MRAGLRERDNSSDTNKSEDELLHRDSSYLMEQQI
jgi:hypothetical protein